jgi:hypothetical protein
MNKKQQIDHSVQARPYLIRAARSLLLIIIRYVSTFAPVFRSGTNLLGHRVSQLTLFLRGDRTSVQATWIGAATLPHAPISQYVRRSGQLVCRWRRVHCRIVCRSVRWGVRRSSRRGVSLSVGQCTRRIPKYGRRWRRRRRRCWSRLEIVESRVHQRRFSARLRRKLC